MPWCPRCGTGLSQMEMNEGYQDREDPGLTVRFPLVDRPGEALLVWTTTPWTLAANVAAAVGADLRYVRVRQGEDHFWLGKGTLKQALRGPFQVVEERAGSELAGWRYTGPFDELPAVAGGVRGGGLRAPRRHLGRGRRGGGDGHRPHRPRLRRRGLPAGPRDRPAGDRAHRRGRALLRRVRLAERPRGPRHQRGDLSRPRAAAVLLPPRAVQPPLSALLALRHAAPVPPRGRVVHQHGRGLRPAARPADDGGGGRLASATRSWRSWTGSGGSRTSATSGSWTGSSTCATG